MARRPLSPPVRNARGWTALAFALLAIVELSSLGCANGPLRRRGLFQGGFMQGQGPLRRLLAARSIMGDVGSPEDLTGELEEGEFLVDEFPVEGEFGDGEYDGGYGSEYIDGEFRVEGEREVLPMPNSPRGPTRSPPEAIPPGTPTPAPPNPSARRIGPRRLLSRLRAQNAPPAESAEAPRDDDDSLPRATEHPKLRRIRPIARLVPTNNADWAPEFEKLATCSFYDDGMIDLKNVRNATWITGEDCVVEWRNQRLDLNDLKTVDFIVVPFNGMTEIAHTFVSFGFGHGDYIGVSVEVRKKRGQRYSTTSGFLNEYELCYVVADERDLLPVRVFQRESQVYVYRSTAPPEKVRRLFVDMMERANRLAERPEFYNTLTNNCTTNLVKHVNHLAPGKIPYDYRVLLPGYSDQLVYDLGLIENRLPFAEVKQRALINERVAQNVDAPDFSARIRR